MRLGSDTTWENTEQFLLSPFFFSQGSQRATASGKTGGAGSVPKTAAGTVEAHKEVLRQGANEINISQVS